MTAHGRLLRNAPRDLDVTGAEEGLRRGKARGPAVVGAVLLAAAIGLQLYAHEQMTDVAHDAAAIGVLQADIMRTDESITLAARMAVETGDPDWERRYDALIAAHGAQLRQLPDALPHRPDIKAKIDDVNRALLALERSAMAAGISGDRESGRAIFDADGYAALKARHLEGARAIVGAYRAAVAGREREGLAAIFLAMLLTLASLAAFVGSLVYLLRRVKREADEAERLRAQLAAQNADLDRIVDERTAELETANQRFALARKAQAVGVWECDLVNNSLVWDSVCCELHGVAEDKFDGRPDNWLQAVHPDDREAALAKFQKVMDGAREYHDVYRIVRPDGETRWLSGDAIVLYDDSDRPHKTVGVSIDITPSMLAKQKLKDAKVAAESANAAKSMFIATMSHELRTPIHGIIGAAQLLDTLGPKPEQREWIDMIRNCGAEIQRLVGGVLDLSRLETGRIEVADRPYSLHEIIEETLMLFNAALRKKSNKIVYAAPSDLPPVLIGDPDRLKQILTNLIGNAVKFTENGTITISTKMLGENLHIEIADTGVGIPTEKLPRIFDRFYQVESGLSRRFEGAGLGLSIVKELSILLGGSVRVKSEPDVGSTFTLIVPARPVVTAPESGVAGDSLADQGSPSTAPLKILIAEDSPLNQAVMKALLERERFEVSVVSDGLEALSAIAREKFDVLLLDIRMPDLDGRAVLGRLRAEPALAKGLKIIVVTAIAHKDAGRELLDLGADAYIAKPADAAYLVAEIHRVTNTATPAALVAVAS